MSASVRCVTAQFAFQTSTLKQTAALSAWQESVCCAPGPCGCVSMTGECLSSADGETASTVWRVLKIKRDALQLSLGQTREWAAGWPVGRPPSLSVCL